ncbi:MAG: S41 family peptidase [Gemmatimonadota bacterium]|nr:S41 family peptidase [Gemmatimonadota bacterium]
MPFPSRSALAVSVAIATLPGGSLIARHSAGRSAQTLAALPSYSEPSISPDGSEIAFVSAGDIWTVPSRGGEARLLVSNEADESRPLYSPDGTRLAFVSTRTGNGDIYVLTLTTGQLTRITYDDQAAQLDNWSHDGAWLYFSSARNDISGMSDEFRVHSAGGTPMPVAADRYAAEYWGAPSPDGSALAITARGVSRGQWWRKGHSHLDESEIDIVRDVHGVPVYTPIVPMGAKGGWPMWSQDGASVYFVSDRTGAANLWIQPAAASAAARKLTSFTDGRVLWPSIAANGSAIVFERDFGIWRYDVSTQQASVVPITLHGSPSSTGVEHRTLSTGFQQFALSPDGRKVAFVVHGEIFAASAKDGGNAARVTNTPAAEDQVSWAPDSRRIVYTSDRDGPRHLYTYDFGTTRETRLTNSPVSDVSPVWSPDGAHIAYTHDARELHVLDLANHADRVVATASLSRAPFLGRSETTFSPDSRWIAYTSTLGARDFADVQVVSVAGGPSRTVDFLANTNTSSIAWSRDGTYLLVSTGQRTEMRQLARIDLVPRTPHFREDQFHDMFREESPRPPSPQTQQQLRRQQPTLPVDTARPSPKRGSDTSTTDSTSRGRPSAQTKSTKPVTIVFDGIRDRLSLLPVEVDVFDVAISPDGKSALLTAGSAGQTNLYVYSLDELAKDAPVARQLTSSAGRKSDAQWSPDGKEVFYLEAGRMNSINVESRVAKPLAVTAEMDVDFSKEKMEVFAEAWSYLRDNFFNPTMNGVDWNAVRANYARRIDGAQTPDQMRRILSLLVGELNSSHSGIGAPAPHPAYAGRIGLGFDRVAYERSGEFRITEVLSLSPAAIAGIRTGEYLTSVNGTPLTSHTNLQELLAYTIGKRTVLSVSAAPGAVAREVAVLPVSTATEKGLLYRAWVEQRRAYVETVSHGRLGYVHMYDMSQDALNQLYVDLDAQNMTRDGVVIDVRNNNGGFVNVYAMDVLARQPYLNMQSRDRPVVAARTQLGQRALERPTVLVTNQHTLSDGEDFTQGYRTLRLGKVVGEPTAGWIIFTSAATLIDGSTVRLPSTRITGLDGVDMEMHPRPVDVEVTRPMGESYGGRDSQLDAAVATLVTQLDSNRHK